MNGGGSIRIRGRNARRIIQAMAEERILRFRETVDNEEVEIVIC